MNTSVEEKIRKLIQDVSGNSKLEVKKESRLIDDLGFDSVDFASLVMSVEEEYNGSVDEDEMKDIVTVADVILLVTNKLQAQA